MIAPPRLRRAPQALLAALAWVAVALGSGCSSGAVRPAPPGAHATPPAAPPVEHTKAQPPPAATPPPAGANPLPLDTYASAVVPRWLTARKPLRHPPFTPHWYTPKVDPLFRHRVPPLDAIPSHPESGAADSTADHPPDDVPPDAYGRPASAASRPQGFANAPAASHRIKDYDAVAPLLHGIASWYGPGFHGKLTASGEVYNQNAMTAAHPTLPLGTLIRVTNEQNGRVAWVRVNDRGPYKKGRVLDLSKRAAERLGMVDEGTAPVRIQVERWPRDTDTELGLRAYSQYVVQVAAYPTSGKAEAMLEDMRQRFRWAHFRLDPRPSGDLAVVSGPYDDNTAALEVARRLQRSGITSLVRRYRK